MGGNYVDVKLFKDGKWYIINGDYVINKQFIKDIQVNWFTVYRQIKINGGKINKFPYFNNKKSAERFKEWLEAQLLALSLACYDNDRIICAGEDITNYDVFVNGILLRKYFDYEIIDGTIMWTGNFKPTIRDIVTIQYKKIKDGDFIINFERITY